MSTQTVDQNEPAFGTYGTRPANLTAEESIAYSRGFDRGARAYVKTNGGPGVIHDETAPVVGSAEWRAMRNTLRVQTAAYLEARHPIAHKAGMTAVKSWVRKYNADPAARLAEIVDPLAPVTVKATRKPRPAKLAKPVSDGAREALAREAAAVKPVTVPEPMPIMTRAARKASHRELAAAMREAGLRPAGQAWELAKAGTPLADIAGLVSA